MDLAHKTIVISRTDSIGDVVLTLPLCGWIKRQFPSAKLIFLGRNYTQPVLECYSAIDEIKNYDNIANLSENQQAEEIKKWKADIFIHVFPHKTLAKGAKKAKVPLRIGTSHRTFHLLTCNVRPNFTRKRSSEHEAQLNFELIKPLGLDTLPKLNQIQELMSLVAPKADFSDKIKNYLTSSTKKIVLHTKSKGSALEWPISKFVELAQQLAQEGKIVFFSGTEEEGQLFREELPETPNIIDLSGQLSLKEFIAFLAHCDTVVACSTGPLHIAAGLGVHAIGLYTTQRPMHPGRWRPIGKKTDVLTSDTKKIKGKTAYLDIAVDDVYKKIIS